MKQTLSSDNKRLYLTEDEYKDNVWYARTEADVIARFTLTDKWEIWFYPYKYRQTRLSLTDTLELIQKVFVQFWNENYGE